VPRRAGASGRAGAIRCDTERARGWSGLSPRPGNRLLGGAPPACQRPFVFWVASEHTNNIVEMRFRVRKVPEVPHLVAPDSRRWRAVGRRALRAMGNIGVRSAGGPCSHAPPPWRHILKRVRNKKRRDSRWLRSRGTGRLGPGQVAPGRGDAGLACPSGFYPDPHGCIVDAQGPMFRDRFGKNFGIFLGENLWVLVRSGWL
jgi:hypothetical protein